MLARRSIVSADPASSRPERGRAGNKLRRAAPLTPPALDTAPQECRVMSETTTHAPATSSPNADPAPEQATGQPDHNAGAALPPDDTTASEEQAPVPTS